MVRASDVERGYIMCSHPGCGQRNELVATVEYNQRLALDLPTHGHLTYLDDPSVVLPLRFGPNVIGTSDTADLRLPRYQHRGRCYISRRHCTLTVTFDQWTGTLRYQLQDGATDPADKTHKPSLNGTLLNGVAVRPSEIIDVGPNGLISLGGADTFQLTQVVIDPIVRETYRIDNDFNADVTQ